MIKLCFSNIKMKCASTVRRGSGDWGATTTTGYGLDGKGVKVRVPVRARFFSLLHVAQTGPGAHPAYPPTSRIRRSIYNHPLKFTLPYLTLPFAEEIILWVNLTVLTGKLKHVCAQIRKTVKLENDITQQVLKSCVGDICPCLFPSTPVIGVMTWGVHTDICHNTINYFVAEHA
jgi:hypothetical protein